tara:strand:- start:96 stop:626 length:531 start_codon:yes stop_codon:yes gene_type:complete
MVGKTFDFTIYQMNQHLKKIASGLILVIGFILFFSSLVNNNLNLALVCLTSTLIFWVLYGLLLDDFDVRVFAWVLSATGVLLAISIFFIFGVEEVPHPVGAIVFHAGGIAGALGMGLFSLFPFLIIHQLKSNTTPTSSPSIKKEKEETFELDPDFESDDWEFATKEELRSGEFEVG